MPPKKKRQQQLEKPGEGKRSEQTEAGSDAQTTETATTMIADNGGEPTGLTQLLTMTNDALDT